MPAVKIDGNLYDLDEEISLEKNIKHTVEIVVDRLALRKGIRSRLADSLETALALTGGIAEIDVIGGECMTFSQNFACRSTAFPSVTCRPGSSPSITRWRLRKMHRPWHLYAGGRGSHPA